MIIQVKMREETGDFLDAVQRHIEAASQRLQFRAGEVPMLSLNFL
jgi:hypothetical protein